MPLFLTRCALFLVSILHSLFFYLLYLFLLCVLFLPPLLFPHTIRFLAFIGLFLVLFHPRRNFCIDLVLLFFFLLLLCGFPLLLLLSQFLSLFINPILLLLCGLSLFRFLLLLRTSQPLSLFTNPILLLLCGLSGLTLSFILCTPLPLSLFTNPILLLLCGLSGFILLILPIKQQLCSCILNTSSLLIHHHSRIVVHPYSLLFSFCPLSQNSCYNLLRSFWILLSYAPGR